jgi:hypothetical protein
VRVRHVFALFWLLIFLRFKILVTGYAFFI